MEINLISLFRGIIFTVSVPEGMKEKSLVTSIMLCKSLMKRGENVIRLVFSDLIVYIINEKSELIDGGSPRYLNTFSNLLIVDYTYLHHIVLNKIITTCTISCCFC